MTEEPTETVTYLTVLFPVLLSVFLSVVFLWNTSVAQNTTSSCWSRGRDRSRAPPDCFWSLQASPPNRTTPVRTSRAEHRRSRMALEQISPPLWSEHWRETDLHSLPVPRRISSVPLPTQCPAHRLPGSQSACLSPPLTKSQSLPRLTCHRCTERQSWRVECATMRVGRLLCLLPVSVLQSPSLQCAFQCWLPFLRSALEVWRLSNAHPPIYSCLFHHCRLAAPLLSLSPSSAGLLSSSIAVVGVSLDSTSEARTPPWPFDPSVPQWLLAPTSPPWLPRPFGSSWVRRRPFFTSGLHSSSFTSSLWLRQAPSSPRLLLSPLSLRLHHGLPDPRLNVGRWHHLLRLGPPDPPRPRCSSALRLSLGHLLRYRWSAPWSRQPFPPPPCWLYRGPSLWEWPRSHQAPLAPGPSCLFPGSSLLRRPLGLCVPAPSWGFINLLSRLLGGGEMSGLWTCLCVCFFFPCDPVSVSQSLCNLFQVCLVPSPIILWLKTPVRSVSVCRFLNVFMCSMFPNWIIKDSHFENSLLPWSVTGIFSLNCIIWMTSGYAFAA